MEQHKNLNKIHLSSHHKISTVHCCVCSVQYNRTFIVYAKLLNSVHELVKPKNQHPGKQQTNKTDRTVPLSITCVILKYGYLILCQVCITYMSGCLPGCLNVLLSMISAFYTLLFLLCLHVHVHLSDCQSLLMSFLVITVISTASPWSNVCQTCCLDCFTFSVFLSVW